MLSWLLAGCSYSSDSLYRESVGSVYVDGSGVAWIGNSEFLGPQGLDRFDAREAVVKAFKEEGLFGGDDPQD